MTDERHPDPPKIIPPIPNLTGDDVRFVRRDASGNPKSWGHMHKDEIARRITSGDNLEIVPADWQPPPSPDPDMALQAQFVIAGALAQADRYFTSDALDNISAAEQAQWRAYRQKLRAAAKLTDPAAMVAAIPVPPKGGDPAANLRNKVKPAK